MSNTFKYTSKTAYNIGKLAYGGVNLGIAAAADTLDYAADKLCDLEEYVCGKPNLIDYSEVTIEQELKLSGNIEQILV